MFNRFLIACLAMTLASVPVHAERADSKQPVNIEADRVSVDDRNKTHTFEGNVVLSQGTLSIRGDRLVVTQNDDGFQKGVATGGRMGAPASGNGAKDAANSSKVWRSGSNTMAAPRKPPCGAAPRSEAAATW